jgi:hypothetical protein
MGRGMAPKKNMSMKRFDLVKGTIVAGTNDPSLINELKDYISYFVTNGMMDMAEGQGILQDIQYL